MINIFYALHDYDPGLKKLGAFAIEQDEMDKYNKLGYGIFWTPNFFENQRKKENLKFLNYWLADIDEGSKQEQMDRINKLRIHPSNIIETRNGYHCYWDIEGECSAEDYGKIELGLIKELKADRACKDITRILRLPDYLHQKDPKNTFKVKMIHCKYVKYTTPQMLFNFDIKEENVKKFNFNHDNKNNLDAMFNEERWDRIFGLDNIGSGNRNSEFSRIRLWLKDKNLNDHEIYSLVSRMNRKIFNPLPETEIKTLCRIKG